MRLRETTGDSLERLMETNETHETQRDYLGLMRLMQRDYLGLMRLRETTGDS